jgi:hypothetical protein
MARWPGSSARVEERDQASVRLAAVFRRVSSPLLIATLPESRLCLCGDELVVLGDLAR